MSRNVEELLREGIDRQAADAEVPASLLHRARQRNRRRRRAIVGAVAAGTAAVTAAAVIAATASTPQTSALQGQTITYVTTRAEQALAHISQGKAIETDTGTATNASFGFMMVTLAANPDGTDQQPPNALSNVHASRLVNWTYRDLMLQQGYSAAGKLVFTATIGPVSTPGGKTKTVSEAYGAAYPDRTQWHTPLIGGPDWGNPALTCPNSGFDYPSWQQGIAKALSCHVFTLAGNQEIDGIDTIKLVRKPLYGISQTLWVDPTSYLPVRIRTTTEQAPKRPAVQTDNFRWLSPTTGNLAALHMAEQRGAVPSGYRSLPSTYVPLPGLDTPLP
jgi:hypothetical protein